jgi:hypothetical protein
MLSSPTAPSRRSAIEQHFATLAGELPHLLERTEARSELATVAAVHASAVFDHAGVDDLAALPVELDAVSDLVTTPKPFLRWDPVIEPTVVPRHPYSEAESLLTMVIRSGVEGPTGSDGLDLTIVDPSTFATSTIAAHPALALQWRADSQRHLLPPKTSQFEAELHGLFDDAIGSNDPAAVRQALAVALRESGTLLDDSVADLTNPGARLAQPGVSLHHGPTAEVPTVTAPGDLTRGDPLGRGQYVVHDVDQLTLPYLPDPLAHGVSMVFPDAGQHRTVKGLLAVEGVNLDYGGAWPEREPYRLVLNTGRELDGRVVGNEISISLPPGEQLRIKLSSSIARSQLDLLALWHSLPAAVRSIELLAQAAADGWFWWLTPAVEIRLVHAVPRPVEVPRPTVLVPVRQAFDTAVTLFGAVDLHGPSTERIDIEGRWTEQIDDVTKPAPTQIEVISAACDTLIGDDEDLVVLGGFDATTPLPDGSSINVHKAVHQLGDTKHRLIDYSIRATSRYREFFDPLVVPTVDDVSVVGPSRRLNVPSTARPAKPIVADVLPLFRWYEETEAAQPFGLRRTRKTGLRIYLERPWFSSGDGELLGVVLAFGNDALTQDHVSQWGGDPIYWQQGPANRAVLPLIDLLHLVGLDDRREGARPVGPPVPRTLVDVAGNPAVWVLGYQPEYSAERQRWFVDVALDPGTAFWPFVRLAVVRMQMSSLPGLHLSPVVRCDMVPLPPQRTATLTRPDERRARVMVTGPVGFPAGFSSGAARRNPLEELAASRTMRARLERVVPEIGTDLGWQTVATLDLAILGVAGTTVSWLGELELPEAIAPQRPGTSVTWRVVVEEWERLPADPIPLTTSPAGVVATTPGFSARMIYADHLPL